jgi:uncharacterized HhH-GPD family protein
VSAGSREAWARLTAFLASSGQPQVTVRFGDIEHIIGRPLPASKQHQAFWSNSSSYAKAWRTAGYVCSRAGCLPEEVRFVRTSVVEDAAHTRRTRLSAVESPIQTKVASGDEETRETTAHVILVGCVKSKLTHPAAARDLYTSTLFTRARAYAERLVAPWFILSAEHGVVNPDEWLSPYDRYLADAPVMYRQAWGAWVAARLELLIGDLRDRVVEVHAGQVYINAIRPHLQARGAQLVEPLAGLTMGERLAWYGATVERPPSLSATGPPDPESAPIHAAADVPSGHRGGSDVVSGPREILSFDYRWPDQPERFSRGWEVEARDRTGKIRRIRHGVGARDAYGRERAHSVTFLDGQPIVEGVAADDYEDSRSLVSPLKHTNRTLVREAEDVPAPYAGMPLADHRIEIDAAYSRNGVAVKLRDDDVLAWAAYALAREEVLAAEAGVPVPAPSPPLPVGRRAGGPSEVTAALLALGRSVATAPHETPSFTPHPDANRLIVEDPFAFLLGVIFDQNIAAERAWRAPYDLKERLGHLDPARIADDLSAVKRAVDTPPKLHRYVERVPEWIVEAARRVVGWYGGDAAAIWGDQPTARQLMKRLDDFPGIGQKKAAMAVELLERDLGVPIIEMSGSDIAYDVHVRRVFLRTGLAQVDDLDHMVAVARQAHPDRPGEIDYPAWLVGRQWCHAGVPDCPACALRMVCPKLVSAAAEVRA